MVDITDRKLTEIALLEAQRIAHIGSWEFDLQTQVITWSEELYHMFGLDPSRPVSPYEEYLQKIHPDDRPKLLQCVEQAIAGGMPYIIDYRIILSDGSIRYQEARGEVIRNAQGQIVALRGTALDISDRKQAELALQQLNEELEQRVQQRTQELARSEQDLRTIFNHVYDAIFIHDLDGTILDVNDRALELHTATREQLIGASIPDVFAPDAPIERLLKMLQRVQAGENLEFEWQGRRFDDGSIFDAEVSLRQVTLGNRPVLIAGVRDISDRKQAEIDLRESQKFLQTVIDTFPLVVFWKDRQSVYLGCNSKSAIVAGLSSPTEIIGKTDYDMPWAAAAAELYRADDREVMESGHAKLGIIEMQLRADGSKVWIETNKLPLRNLNGEVIGVLGTYQDITDRKQAEADLRNSEERFRAAFEQAAVGMIQVDLEGRFTQMNQKFCDIVGYLESELLLKSFGEITHPDDLTADDANVRRLLAGEASTFVMEKRYFRKNGTIVWVNLSVSLVKNSAGEPQYFIAVVEDISSRKQAEQQLRAERLRLQLALEAADMGTWESNLETGIWSARTEEIFGYAPGTFPGDREAFLRLVHIDDQERVFAALSHSFATRSPYKVEYRINHLNGELRWVAVNGKVVESEDGSGLRMVGVALDITERKQAEAALRDSEERLRLALAAANQGLYDLNVQTGKVIVSPEYAAMLGYDPATFEETNAK
ncbi:MAG: PAS domain S-box protein [Leptodesmis sp.]|uniref:PAS domain-containing protein n=1 Tax=Leptodesmis sp. TaxID=3100501 RepID=UPI003D14655B